VYAKNVAKKIYFLAVCDLWLYSKTLLKTLLTHPPQFFHYLTCTTQKSAAVSAIAELLSLDVLLVVKPLIVSLSCDCSGDNPSLDTTCSNENFTDSVKTKV